MFKHKKKTKKTHQYQSIHAIRNAWSTFKDIPGGIPKSDLLGVPVALIHVAGQIFLAV